VTQGFRERQGPEGFLASLAFLALQAPQESRVTGACLGTLALQGWERRDLRAHLDLMDLKGLRGWENLVPRVSEGLQGSMEDAACQEDLVLWGPLATVSSVRPCRCRQTGATTRRGPKLCGQNLGNPGEAPEPEDCLATRNLSPALACTCEGPNMGPGLRITLLHCPETCDKSLDFHFHHHHHHHHCRFKVRLIYVPLSSCEGVPLLSF